MRLGAFEVVLILLAIGLPTSISLLYIYLRKVKNPKK
jgi:hypothetical protein